MQFESCGVLTGMTPVEATRLFCGVINPSGQVFHPTFFLEEIQRRITKGYTEKHKSFYESSLISNILGRSYEKAVTDHRQNMSKGPLPNKITSKYFKNWRFTGIQYRTNGGTTIRLGIPHKSLRESRFCTIVITGYHITEVVRRSTLAGLPYPVKVPVVYEDTLPELTQPTPSLAPSVLDIRVPLGEIFDLIKDTSIPLGSLLSIIEKYR